MQKYKYVCSCLFISSGSVESHLTSAAHSHTHLHRHHLHVVEVRSISEDQLSMEISQ